jgi:hypothetical protein
MSGFILNCFSHLNWPSLFFEDEHLYGLPFEGSKLCNYVFQQVITLLFSLKFDISEVKSCAEMNPAEYLIAPYPAHCPRGRDWCAVPAQGHLSGATDMPQRRGWCAPFSTEAQAKGLPEGSKDCQSIQDHQFHIFPWIAAPV